MSRTGRAGLSAVAPCTSPPGSGQRSGTSARTAVSAPCAAPLPAGARFGVHLVHFSVQGNHLHMIVEAPDAESLARAMKGLEVRMARALNRVMRRRGPVFADRYHAHLLRSPREAANAIRYVLENWRVHKLCAPGVEQHVVDPYCSTAWRDTYPALTMPPEGWLLSVGSRSTEQRMRPTG